MPSDGRPLSATETERPRKPCSSDLVPRHWTLDGFIESVSQADGIGLAHVDAFTTLVAHSQVNESGPI